MIQLKRTDSSHPDFLHLVQMLDADLSVRDGKEHSFYAQFNKVTAIKHVLVAYDQETPVGCGAIKEYATSVMEIKRMFLLPQYRGKGIAGEILLALEKWAIEMQYTTILLETGKRQPEAIALYTKHGYIKTENYGQYAGIENSVCFKKTIVFS